MTIERLTYGPSIFISLLSLSATDTVLTVMAVSRKNRANTVGSLKMLSVIPITVRDITEVNAATEVYLKYGTSSLLRPRYEKNSLSSVIMRTAKIKVPTIPRDTVSAVYRLP